MYYDLARLPRDATMVAQKWSLVLLFTSCLKFRSAEIRSGTKQKASSILRASQAVPHPSTDRTLQRLTLEFG